MLPVLIIAFLIAFLILTCVCVIGVVLSQFTINRRTDKTRRMANYAVGVAEKAIDDTSKLDEELSTIVELFKEIKDKVYSQPEEVTDKPPDEEPAPEGKKDVEEQYEKMQSFQVTDYGLNFGGTDADNS